MNMNRDNQSDFIPGILDGMIESLDHKETHMKPIFVNTMNEGAISLNKVHRFYVERVISQTGEFSGWAVIACAHHYEFTLMIVQDKKEAWKAIGEYVEVMGADLNN